MKKNKVTKRWEVPVFLDGAEMALILAWSYPDTQNIDPKRRYFTKLADRIADKTCIGLATLHGGPKKGM